MTDYDFQYQLAQKGKYAEAESIVQKAITSLNSSDQDTLPLAACLNEVRYTHALLR
jgi:hypothetical protein